MTKIRNRLLFDYGYNHPIFKNYMRGNKMSEDVFEDVESQMFKFKKEGDELIGILISNVPSRTYKNRVYKIKTEDQESCIVFGTAVLDSQMETVNIGDKVKIVFLGEKPPKKKGQKPTKMFKVGVAKTQ